MQNVTEMNKVASQQAPPLEAYSNYLGKLMENTDIKVLPQKA